MKPIFARTRTDAWAQTVEHLLRQDEEYDFDIVLEIKNPLQSNNAVSNAEAEVDSFLRAANLAPLHTVAETIFPAWEYRAHGIDGVYKTYPEEIFPRLMRHNDFNWGTYAHRLLRGTDTKKNFNPLRKCVEKLKDEAGKLGPKRACFEIGLSVPSIDLPLYDANKDGAKRRGLPCLSHLSFKLAPGKRLLLTAMYRSHDYTQKALGNLLGLARLQAFVAEQAELEVGPLVCHSTYAWLDKGTGRGLKRIEELISAVRQHEPPSSPTESK